ncbi:MULTISPECIES: thermonuclease family protein [Alphaproteobacteria]|uniref:Membrane protein n=2 Tax=Alphaproteobacteria TaxID=28211 RepID=A0A512HDL0_9HYPH|nr:MULTISPECIES: thermonuclease family protein [Alphaproteobacteria]GEO83543.1 membrane protein [Ciceribacter naphthalenivorans]GLR24306.1 membrane protein [Ciceribacter naphthalenivorans]GLT07162.1 membrane protein [Sphingomonas psychrolutea]
MRPLGTLVTGLAGLALWAALLSVAGRNIGTRESDTFEIDDMSTEWAEPADITDATPALEPAPAAIPSEALKPLDLSGDGDGTETGVPAEAAAGTTTATQGSNRGVRAVNPELFASPLTEALGPLERVAPLETKTPAPQRVKLVLLPRPESVEAGLIAFGLRNLKLADITSTDRMRVCPTASGGNWPCGMVARTQQRMFLRNRTIACDADKADWEGTIEAHCQVGEIDIATWLAENGWVETPPGSPLGSLSERARSERRGIFGDDQR